MTIRIVSWNIMHPRKMDRIQSVMDVLKNLEPDLVALQEVLVEETDKEFKVRMKGIGLEHIIVHPHMSGRGLLVASRWKIKRLRKAHLKVQSCEEAYHREQAFKPRKRLNARLLSVRVMHGGVPFELHNVHVPYGSKRGGRKVDTFRSVTRRMARPTDCPRILCGDFNEPRKEQRDGRVITWAKYNIYSKSADPDAWDKAVKAIFEELPERGVRDAVRYVKGERVIHQVSYPAKGNGRPRRYDHVFASEQPRPVEARYIKISRKVSDHRPVLVVFEDQ